MSWVHVPTSRFSAARAGATLRANGCSDGSASATSKSTTTASGCSSRESRTGCSTTHRSGTTPEHSTGDLGVDEWIASLPVSPASPSPSPANDAAKTTSGTCGPPPSSAFAWYDRNGRCWRTYQGCLFTNTSERFSATWPRAGWMRDGACYRRRIAGRLTYGKESLYWPTPVASDGFRAKLKLSSLKRAYCRKITDPYHAKHGCRVLTEELAALGDTCQTTGITQWLMGWPPNWTSLEPLAMDRFRSWLQRHGGC